MDKYFEHLDHQDWKTIKVNKDPKENIEKKKKKVNSNIQNIKKIEKKAEEDNLKHIKITNELKNNIIKGRIAIGLTQKELSKKCNFPLQIINEIETGKAIYNYNHINKIKRVLKMK